jgi:hypothetical protein
MSMTNSLPTYRSVKLRFAALCCAMLLGAPAESQAPALSPALTYADIADLGLPAPIVAQVQVSGASRLKGEAAGQIPPGKARFLVEATVISLLKGRGALPPKVNYLVDLPLSPAGRAPKLAKKSQHILFASPVPGRPADLRLVASDAHIPASVGEIERVRNILGEAARPDAAPRISGIGRAFHVPGSIQGESETQLFLQTADGRPVSLNVLRRPGERPRWAVALAEIVDDSAGPPRRDSLLWYRLACTLPRSLPRSSLSDSDPAFTAAIQIDYRLIMDALGPCTRNRGAVRPAV